MYGSVRSSAGKVQRFSRLIALLGQKNLNVGGHALWCVGGGVTLDHLAVFVHQEFCEIPLDGLGAEQAGCLGRQPLVERMGLTAVDIYLCHHGKAYAVIQLAELGDLFIVALVLRAKLVARKTQHHQPSLAIGLVQFFQSGKLGCEAAGAGGVDNEHGLALVLFQGNRLARDIQGGEVVNNSGHGVFIP